MSAASPRGMNAVTTAAGDLTTEGLDRAAFVLLLAFVAAVQLSIASAQLLLAAAAVCWLLQKARDRATPSAPGFFLPLAAYGAATLVSSAFSQDPATSFLDSRQLLLFAVVPIVYDVAARERAPILLAIIISVGAASAAIGIGQYGLFHYDSLAKRPAGALGPNYMTYSGTLMLVACAAMSRVLFGSRKRLWPALVLPAVIVAVSLTFSRNAWVGVCVAAGLLLVLRDFRLTALLPVVVAFLFVFAPERITDRMMSMFDLRDPSNSDRLSMMRTGAAMVRDHPFAGVGPDMIPQLYTRYRVEGSVNPTNPHLHNVPLQIAAERGLPALGIWLWFVGACSLQLARRFRQQTDRILPAAALAAIAAMLAAGLFEYNFGDSEFLMLLLVMITLPFAEARPPRAS